MADRCDLTEAGEGLDLEDLDTASEALAMLQCPYYQGVGMCNNGCTSEPACHTNRPKGGWLQQARNALAVQPPPQTNLLPCPKCGADGWSYCRDRKGEPLPLDRSHVDRRTRGVVTL